MENLSFTQVGILVGAIVLLLGIAVAIKVLLHRDPPLHKEFVDRKTYEDDQKEINQEFARQAAARKKVYETIEAHGRSIAEVKTEMGSQTRQLHALDSKMDQLPERLIRIMDHRKAQ